MLHPLIDPPKSRDTRNTLLFKIVRKEIIQLLGLDPRVTDDELILQRNQRYRANPKEYVDMLFKDVGLESLLVDYGFPVMGSRLAQDELDWFHQTSSSIPTRRIHRVEATYHRLFEEKVPFGELEETYLRELRDEVENRGTIAFKTVIAYHTGLKINKISTSRAAASYSRLWNRRTILKPKKMSVTISYCSRSSCAWNMTFQFRCIREQGMPRCWM